MSGLFNTPTLIMAGVIAALTVIVGWRRPFVMLSILVLGVPFRDFITRWLFVHTSMNIDQVTAIGRWWFVDILALLALLVGRVTAEFIRDPSKLRPSRTTVLFFGVVAVAMVATVLSPSRLAAITSFRGYVQPMLVFLLALVMSPSRRELRVLLIAWLVVGAIVAAFGVVQAATWDELNYRNSGYVRQDGQLVVPTAEIGGELYLRPASIVSGPNELALDMVIIIVMAIMWMPGESLAQWVGLGMLALLYTAALGATVSRSGALAFGGSVLTVAALRISDFRSLARDVGLDSPAKIVVAGVAVAIVVLLVFSSFGMVSLLAATISSLGQEYHFIDSMEAAQYLIEHPGGVGMGLVEPKGAFALLALEAAYHVEGSIFQIAMEMSVLGLALWLIFWVAALVRIAQGWPSLKNKYLRIVSGTALAGWIGALIAFLILPLMQSISLMVWLWFLLGLGVQSETLQKEWIAEAGADAT